MGLACLSIANKWLLLLPTFSKTYHECPHFFPPSKSKSGSLSPSKGLRALRGGTQTIPIAMAIAEGLQALRAGIQTSTYNALPRIGFHRESRQESVLS